MVTGLPARRDSIIVSPDRVQLRVGTVSGS